MHNRLIKFRFWDGMKMLFIFHITASGCAWYWDDYTCRTGLDLNGRLMQFTGLKDKNGKEIYEGDIDKRFGVVKWLEDSCEYVFENDEGFVSLPKNFCESESEVIGNIYEHPNLIK